MTKKIAHSSAYLTAAHLLDGGWRGTYTDLGDLIGTRFQGIGSIVRKYARLHPAWDHWAVVDRHGRPAYHR